ncbi:agamous-like MADS-box protein AGL80 [Triticum dicoccoides]|uniref:agamous-like MADS-box protein AGL80 n=1 Tax=Triticum dicoccoides TaxID=85692 RepID=UPI001891E21F|nr:agamous-like MADS-box protein AGL80 [Triticum dicoccoides]
MKKADELSVLCDCKTCVLVYDEDKAAPEVFPSHAEAVDILNQFKSMPELGQCKEVMNQKGFINKRIDKLQEQVDKTRRECEDGEIRSLLHKTMHGDLSGLIGLNIEELTKVGYKVDVLLKSISKRMAKIHSQAPAPAPCVATGIIDMGSHALYPAPPQQESQLDMVRSGVDLNTLVYGGYTGANFSSNDMMMQM